MAATKQDIQRWLYEAPQGTTHMAVFCDQIDWNDNPVYIMEGEDPKQRVIEYPKKMGNAYVLMEVYNLSMDLDKQMAEHRALHY